MNGVRADYQKRSGDSNDVRCLLCPHGCVIADGGYGKCGVRENRGGVLYCTHYGLVSALALDPIEKKPLARFKPGSAVLSAGGYGCNFTCSFCQNWHISQTARHAHGGTPESGAGGYPLTMSPAQLAEAARNAVPRGNCGLAFTYNEPMINFEYMRDTFRLVRREGLSTVVVSNGYINPKPLDDLLPLVDAMNIDLKAFTDDFYRRMCGGTLDPVMRTIRRAAEKTHIEVTTLVIPGLNSSTGEIANLAAWLAGIRPDIPLHLSRHHPDYRMSEPAPIPVDELLFLADTARKYLEYVYVGNV